MSRGKRYQPEQVVIAAINLDQLAKALPPQPRLMEGLPLLARQP
ncbi:hypothetical protein [Tunturiibacter gelidoferens]|jgi:hypothetical protein|uniref:Uncharacterized protein n=1 Tax=Tunturiibacter gelidiferens TaxID=3069689 RepID=A0A9X0QK12_9BACT|nr:hypothetical protein [Edaphobacter lichenicola]MBB5331730.1 hypothetical protein [Edaphobacter lichenicola]